MVIEKLKSPFSPEALRGMAEDRIHAEYAGIPETMDSFWLSIDSIVQEEIEHRKGRLARSLERPDLRTEHEEREEKQHNKSIIQMEKTLKLFRKERKRLGKKKVEELDKIVKDRKMFDKIQEKGLSTFQDSLLEDTIDPDVAMEISDIFAEVLGRIDPEGGIEGVLDNIEEHLEEFKRVRSEEKNKGREHRSPLPWWKIAGIAAYLCVAAYFLFICLQQQTDVVRIIACLIYRLGIKSASIAVIKAIIAWC